MIITIDVTALSLIASFVGLAFFAAGMAVARHSAEADTLRRLIDRAEGMMFVPANLADVAKELLPPLEQEIRTRSGEAVRHIAENLNGNAEFIRQQVGDAVAQAIRDNLPTEQKFRETVAAMIKVAKVGEAVEKASRGRKRI